MAHGDQLGRALGGSDAGKPRDLQRVSLGIARQSLEHARREHDERRRLRLAPRSSLGGDIDHLRLPPAVVMGELLLHFFSSASTSSACPSALTLGKTCARRPWASIRNVVRSMPITFLPYMFFSLTTSKASATFLSGSESRVNGRSYFSLNFFCALGWSGEMPSTTAPAFCILLYASRNPHASMVQPGVSALGKKYTTTFFPR